MKEAFRARSGRGLTKKSLVVDERAVRALRRALNAATDSEAVRIAVRDRLGLEEAEAAFDRIRARGGIDDIFRRSAPNARKRAG